MSVVAPAVYVGTWHKYNCGSIAGRWFDLTTFDDERDFFAACRALHQDEADPELMFQDYEGFPGNMASEYAGGPRLRRCPSCPSWCEAFFCYVVSVVLISGGGDTFGSRLPGGIRSSGPTPTGSCWRTRQSP
ncbi:antirestriction protein ArdA, partial [Shigella sonnei]|uniref:antirestriction protein ArdA n=1 Tax=Shigella sonnei TaxID=624 RepID=UPI0020920CCB